MKIGFYGSSFCYARSNKDSVRYSYSTYIDKLSQHYHADICHLGESGCGVWDIIITQFKELLNDPPDVAVFTWPCNATLFHRQYRYLHKLSILPGSKINKADPKVWEATCNYFESLFDYEKDILEFKSALTYFDMVMLPKLKNVKVIHLWEYGILNHTDEGFFTDLSTADFIKSVRYPINWTNGVEIRSPLMAISAAGQWPRRANLAKVLVNDPRCNHLDGELKNNLLFNWIKNAVDNYANGVIIDKIDETVLFYKEFLGV